VPVVGLCQGRWFWRREVDDPLARLRTQTGLLLGRNTLYRGWTFDEELAKPFGLELRKNLVDDIGSIPTPQLEAELKKRLRSSSYVPQVQIITTGDEIAIGAYDPNKPEDRAAFRSYLERLRALPPAERVRQYALHAEPPDPAKTDLTRDPRDGRAFYWSRLFGYDRGIDGLAQRTAIVEGTLGKDVRVGANFSPHPHYWPHAGQWWRTFRRRGMTMPWTEDWTYEMPEASPEIVSYLVDVFRAGAKYESMPIQVYTIPHWPGQTGRDLRLSFVSALAHGNQVVNFFMGTPVYNYSQDYVSWDAPETWHAIQNLDHELALGDDIISTGHVRPARIAILLSFSTDIHEEARGSSIYNFERKNLYLGLRHAGIPVDFLSEEDIAEGWLERNEKAGRGGYDALIIAGDHLLHAAAPEIVNWVRRGGHLVAVAGGGFLDEYDRPQLEMAGLFGVAHQKVELFEKNLWAKEGLAWSPTRDTVTLEDGPHFPGLIALQELAPMKGTRVLGRFDNGSPAVLRVSTGRGEATLIGTFPGSAYLKPAIPKRPYDRGSSDESFNHFLPTTFDPVPQNLVVSALGGDPARPVLASEPMIDATVIDAPKGAAVALANYSGHSIGSLSLKIHGIPRGASAVSSQHGALELKAWEDGVATEMPLAVEDVVWIRW
jgi:hypothetical protein